MTEKFRAPRNRTLALSVTDRERLAPRLKRVSTPLTLSDVLDSTLQQDAFEVLPLLPSASFPLIFVDPPYNLTKTFNQITFHQRDKVAYTDWLRLWVPQLARLLTPTGSLYVCADWRSSSAVQHVLEDYFIIRNRITWEREKGRGAARNWKNASEDIWFATASDSYTFNVDAVKLRRRVVAPYRDSDGKPKDWEATRSGQFRLTYPSNLWTDITVPFWSMPENTDHPTQKPEKLLAKIILASSNKGDIVLDPFAGVGTTAVAAKKLGRHFVSIELDLEYALLTERRLELAVQDNTIQGYVDGVFLERNTQPPTAAEFVPPAVQTSFLDEE